MNRHDDKTESYVALTKGTEVSQYRIIERIGSGGMGEVYLGTGETKKAVAILEKAMSLWDEDRFDRTGEAVTGHFYLGQAYEAAGQKQDAIEQYETFLDIWKNADEGLETVEDAKARLANLKASR